MVTARVVGYAYPWDVLGDPAFVSRVRALGVTEVALAASYHATRAATPLHPEHLVVEAREAALYRPVRQRAWAGHRLVPLAADWVPGDDPFGAATVRLRAAGISVTAWIVLAHATHLGTAHPDVAVRNHRGDCYPYALCPANPEVRQYAATLAAEAVRGVPVDGVSLEACGQLGIAHNGRHEKTAGVFPPAAQRALSVCCCGYCTADWIRRGQDPDQVAERLSAAVGGVLAGTYGADAPMAELVGDRIAEIVLATRRDFAAALRADVLAAVHRHAPSARITLHGRADPWATSPDVAVDADTVRPAAATTDPATSADRTATVDRTAIDDRIGGADQAATGDRTGGDRAGGVPMVDAVLTACWPTTAASVEALAHTRSVLPDEVALGAYLTVLPPADPARVVDHAGALLGAGATELHLYHLGLAPPSGQQQLAEIVRRCRTDESADDSEPDPTDADPTELGPSL
ncbi:hypothetical protein [Actinocatenispora sera]|uniref:Alanine-rich protein n=1 Tax=Actinocatenispora sera TaxID=390989 RepID=A0A810L5Z8_9ACTN|nr:hypothetical protein [Actinocatenispora sera]BCJ30657.1 hypothetical protein Asera_47650 [Actinocatenispora sera]